MKISRDCACVTGESNRSARPPAIFIEGLRDVVEGVREIRSDIDCEDLRCIRQGIREIREGVQDLCDGLNAILCGDHCRGIGCIGEGIGDVEDGLCLLERSLETDAA